MAVVGREGTVPIALDIYYTPLVSYLFLSSRGLYSVWGVLDSWGGKSLPPSLTQQQADRKKHFTFPLPV